MSANSPSKVLFGFHAINVRLKTAPKSVIEIYHDATRRDARMRQFIAKASDMGMNLTANALSNWLEATATKASLPR
jgi:RNA 2'-O ribose methyltransferase substrate binding